MTRDVMLGPRGWEGNTGAANMGVTMRLMFSMKV